MHYPNFFIVGMPRSGTTSLYSYLKQHPEVYLSILKEPHFFSTDLTSIPVYVKDENEYLGLFNSVKNEKIIGEASVWYLTSKVAASKINAFSPESKILIMLRNPADMLFSLYNLYIRTENEDADSFEVALEKIDQRRKGYQLPEKSYFPEGLMYTDIGLYFEKIKRYINIFDSRRLKVVVFEKFITNPLSELQSIMEFLQISKTYPIELDLKKAKRIISEKVISQLKNSTKEIREKVRIKNGKTHLGSKPIPFHRETKEKLLQYFSDDIYKTSQLLNIDLQYWLSN